MQARATMRVRECLPVSGFACSLPSPVLQIATHVAQEEDGGGGRGGAGRARMDAHNLPTQCLTSEDVERMRDAAEGNCIICMQVGTRSCVVALTC